MFVSVDGKAKEVKEVFAGGADGLAHKVDEMFGSVDGVAKLVYTSATEPSPFDDFTWAEIKELADNGLLLNYFKRFDKVNIKLKTPLHGESGLTKEEWDQDTLTMVISEISETGMRLVSHHATPYGYDFSISNELYKNYLQTHMKDRWITVGDQWGMCEKLYNYCKIIDDSLPDDLRNVLTSFKPLAVYEKYVDEEGKTRLRQEYTDCRVRQLSSNGYSYHQEYVEERGRNEWILDTSYFARTESGFKKYVPEAARHRMDWMNDCFYCASFRYWDETTNSYPYWEYSLRWQDPDISWIWDWEDYWGTNCRGSIDNPTYYKITNTGSSIIIPEIQIGIL